MVFSCREGQGFPGLIDLVDFKWLMGAEGHPVHLERLQADRAYAQQCLHRALASGSQTLKRCAARLNAALAAIPA